MNAIIGTGRERISVSANLRAELEKLRLRGLTLDDCISVFGFELEQTPTFPPVPDTSGIECQGGGPVDENGEPL